MKLLQDLYYGIFRSKMKNLYVERDEIKLSMRVLKNELTEEKRAKLAEEVFSKIEKLKSFQDSKRILFFWAKELDIPTQNYILKWSENKDILLPKIKYKKMEIRRFIGTQDTSKENSFKFEPKMEPYMEDIDLAIIPAVVFDHEKYRMGQGRHYYNQFLKGKKIKTIGVGYDFQVIDEIPHYWRDTKLDIIITPKKMLR